MDNALTLNAETSLAGAILIDGRCLDRVAGIVSPGDFQSRLCGAVLEAALALAAAGSPVDPVPICDRLKAQGVITDLKPLGQLMDLTPTAANAELYARKIADTSRRRRLREIAQGILDDSATETDAMLADVSTKIEHLCDDTASGRLVTSSEALHAVFDSLRDREAGILNVVPTGFRRLDSVLGGGFLKSGLYILAARPGIGKSTFALALAENIAKTGGVLFVSLEMPPEQLTSKRIAAATGIPAQRILMGSGLSEEEYTKLCTASAALSESGLTISTKARTVPEVAALSRSVKDLRLVVVDYLGLLTYTEKNRYEGITRISGDLKKLAMQLGVPVVALAQLNRQTEARGDKRPTLADLRDSGAIEQDADAVLLLYRGDYYTGEEPKTAWEPSLLECEAAKNRHGATGKVYFNGYLPVSRIAEA